VKGIGNADPLLFYAADEPLAETGFADKIIEEFSEDFGIFVIQWGLGTAHDLDDFVIELSSAVRVLGHGTDTGAQGGNHPLLTMTGDTESFHCQVPLLHFCGDGTRIEFNIVATAIDPHQAAVICPTCATVNI
jgi:hypothetical protein